MYVSKEQYQTVINLFLNDRHGSIVKLVDADGKIFGFLMRCETDIKTDVTFSINLVDGYPQLKNIRFIKYCMMLRTLNKWKKSKSIFSFKNVKNKKFEDSLKNEINCLSGFLTELKYKINTDELYKYILKNITNIEKYYKNDNFNLILI